jgi:sulfatase modifying factor 1
MIALLSAAGMAQASYVTIGHAGNNAQSASNRSHSKSGGDGYGAVGYTYQISKYEVTIAQMQASNAGNGNENYWNATVGTNAPAVSTSLYEARKYCNWLTAALYGSSAYNLYSADGTGAGSYTRAQAIAADRLVYALPTEDEWYKAAYFKADGSGYSLFAFGLDTVPGVETDSNYGGTGGTYPGTWAVGTGNVEQNGTYDMMGNVWEWMEASDGVLRGGSYNTNEYYLASSDRRNYTPDKGTTSIGFRVVAIPEPATALLLAIGGGVAWLARLKQRL